MQWISKNASDFYFILKREKMGKSYSQRSNDQRSNTKNPNNPAYKKAMDNRANQL
ncbi:hypothetical protein [Helicobacter pylori]|uniref:hypothetical protein n=1 Tax=Helicobacter pylori TaxID=210 RepID=UPI001AA5958D|nr:hypothetical protein [Helicobacter pylori]GHQ89016.1 hypothetical protein JP0085_01720 [Helicobacter pylori]GHS16299.1 hypothetical protein JP0117_01720 [Helicobacter pylori]GHS34258.1 hypothetical protein JP0121_01720 [Helicobacter pylori]